MPCDFFNSEIYHLLSIPKWKSLGTRVDQEALEACEAFIRSQAGEAGD
jgi:hypothetical protein